MKTRCPAVHVTNFEPCDARELEPLTAWLRDSQPVLDRLTFPRGSVLSDGRLDLCKQSLGADNARRVFEALADNSLVQSVLLGTNALGDEGAQVLAELVQRAPEQGCVPNLKTLYLGCNRIRSLGFEALAHSVESNRNVSALWLKRNPLGSDSAPRIAQLIERKPELKVLDLTNTEIGYPACELILEAVGKSKLEHLSLGAQGLPPQAGFALAKCIRDSANLKSLALAVNYLGDDGATELAAGLTRNRSLERLDLSSNDIGDAGLKLLLAALSKHPRLQVLKLGRAPSTQVLEGKRNRITQASALDIALYVRSAPSLKELDLGDADLRSRGAYPIIAEHAHRAEPMSELKLGRGVAKSLRHRLTRELGQRLPCPKHIAAIVSVYR